MKHLPGALAKPAQGLAFVAVFTVLFFSYAFNGLGIVSDTWPRPWDQYSYNRLIVPSVTDPHLPLIYPLIKISDTGERAAYESQFGLQGMAMRAARRLWPGSDSSFFAGAQVAAGTLLAVVLTGLLWSVRPLLGTIPVVGTAIALAMAPRLVVAATDPYWWLGLHFAPAMIVWWGYPRVRSGNMRMATLAVMAGAAVMVKFLCGYEFVSTILLAPLFAIPFWEPLRAWPSRQVIMRVLGLGAALAAGFALALACHALEGWWVLGRSVFGHLLMKGEARSMGHKYVDYVLNDIGPMFRSNYYHSVVGTWTWFGGGASRLTEIFKAISSDYGALGASVIAGYFFEAAIGWPGLLPTYFLIPLGGGLTFADLFGLSLLSLAVAAILGRRDARFALPLRIGCVSMLSLMAPCSWFVLGFGHSVIHGYIVPVVLFLPWTILMLLCIFATAVALVEWTIARTGASRVPPPLAGGG
jgi:hypothetical protein